VVKNLPRYNKNVPSTNAEEAFIFFREQGRTQILEETFT